jgi:hypothetical protein
MSIWAEPERHILAGLRLDRATSPPVIYETFQRGRVMQMAKIFRPIRWPHTGRTEGRPTASSPEPATEAADRESRVGTQPVTNPFPSGKTEVPAPITDIGGHTEEDEGAWLALLELIFETTGWPDAE